MKKSFMDKKATDMTVLELTKFTGLLFVISMMTWLAVCYVAYKIEDIINAFESTGAKINSKLRSMYWTWIKRKPEKA